MDENAIIKQIIFTLTYAYATLNRTTMDGRRCANKFQQEGKVYTDCTTVKSPDGKNLAKEWCYVNPSDGGTPNWDYCAPQLDYDTVREKANLLAAEFLPELRKAIQLVEDQIVPTSEISIGYEAIQNQQSILDKETTQLENALQQILLVQEQLIRMQKQWEAWEIEIAKVIEEIEELKNEQPEFIEQDCEGILGYEKDNPGDGMQGEYYNNEDFLGNPLIKEDMGVDFDWNGESPMEGIYPDNFSIRWTTFLKIPVTGKYQFKVFSDDGCAVYINNVLIVSHFMGTTDGPRESQDDPNQPIKSHLESNINNFEEGVRVKPQRKSSSWSQQVSLSSDTLYKVQILYYHSIHSKFSEDARTYFKLFWKSDQFTEVEIHQDYVYQSNKQPPLKIVNYNSSFMIQFTLENNELAFIDTNTYVITDIPPQYLGLVQLKLPQILMMKQIDINANRPIILFIAVNMKEPNPLGVEFKDTGETMTLLKISKHAEVKQGSIRASLSYGYKIYKRHYQQSDILIQLGVEEDDDEDNQQEKDTKETKKAGVSIIMWYQLDPSAGSQLSCGGLETEISKNDSPSFKECKASSELNDQYKCNYAFTGQMIDNPFKIWSSDGESVGAWIEITFKEEYQVNYIVYKNRDNMGERNRKLEIQFSNGLILVHELKNTDSVQTIRFNPVVCRSIKFTILSVYTGNNNGGSFQIFGMECVDNSVVKKKEEVATEDSPSSSATEEEEEKKKEEEEEQEEIDLLQLGCKDTIVNNEYLAKKNYKPGDSFKATCTEICAEQKDIKIYGSRVYSEDSSLCKSSEHMGVNLPGKIFKVIVERFRNMYESSAQNGMQSENKITNEGSKSVSFETVKDKGLEALDKIKIGQKVDFFDLKQKKWVEAIIKDLDRRKLELLFITIGKLGYSDEFNESIQYPNPERVANCGEKLSSRKDCGPQQAVDKKKQKSIKICFTSAEICGEDYPDMLVDNGFTKKQQHGYKYGWDLDASKNLRKRGKEQDPLLDNLILFPPDTKSQWCQGPGASPQISCMPLKWSIELDNGPYDVKVTVGDPANSFQANINVNGQSLIDQTLKRGQFYTNEFTVLVSQGLVTIDAECKAANCNNAWSRINYVEITKKIVPPKLNDDPPKNLGCGNSFQGGSCSMGLQVENCVFNSVSDQGLHNCGQQFILVKIPKLYECKDQREKFKCIKKDYKDANECRKSCPGKCKDNECQVLPY